MSGYWETGKQNAVQMYSFAPFLEEAVILLIGASRLWHPWSVKRREELLTISRELQGRAKLFRERCLVRVSDISKFGEDPSYALYQSAFYRFNEGAKQTSPFPEATPYLVSAALQILFFLLPAFQKMEEDSHEGKGLTKWLSLIIETIMESPCRNPVDVLPAPALEAAVTHGILLECEGLAYMQAMMEDRFVRVNKKERRRKKSERTDAELHALADEIGAPFEAVKEAFETEYSSWWDKVTEYRNKAQEQKNIFLTFIPDTHARELVGSAWNSGMLTENARPDCWSEKELQKSEKIIQTFILLLLYFIAHGTLRIPFSEASKASR